MLILRDKCNSCNRCTVYCPVNAIEKKKKYYEVNLDRCVECYNCYRSRVCRQDALYPQKLAWPRSIRNLLSDVMSIAPESGISGRGTEEMKTNEVTGRYQEGEVGVAVEMGRPLISSRLLDVEKIAMKLAPLGVQFELDNPITTLIENKSTGKFKEEVLQEICLSAIIEAKTKLEQLPAIIKALKEVEDEIDTVFSLCVVSKLDEQDNNPSLKVLDQMGIPYRPNGKLNVGLGRPLWEHRIVWCQKGSTAS